jgi:hypothetical protein
MDIKQLAIKYSVSGFSADIEAFANALIGDSEPYAWCYVSSKTSCDKFSFNRPTKDFVQNSEFPLYTKPPSNKEADVIERCAVECEKYDGLRHNGVGEIIRALKKK